MTMDHFENLCDDQLITVGQLVKHMGTIVSDPYDEKYMKKKIEARYGDTIVIKKIGAVKNVILDVQAGDWTHCLPQDSMDDEEKILSVVELAATLLGDAIRSQDFDTDIFFRYEIHIDRFTN